jgi:thiamine kinase-like enzyme
MLPFSGHRAPTSCKAGQGSLSLIDWEYSAMCEPVWDLAGLAIEARLDAAQRRRLLEAYDATGGENRAARVQLFQALLHLVAASWAAAQAVAAEDADAFRGLADDYSRRAEPLIASLEFQALVASLH